MTCETSVTTEFPTGWDELRAVDTTDLPRHELHTSQRWVARASALGQRPTDLVVAHGGDAGLTGGLVTQRVELDETLPRIALRGVLPDELFPVRTLGGLYDGRSTPVHRDPASEPALRDVDQLVAAAEDHARASGERGVCFRTVDSSAHSLLGLLRDRGYVELPGVDHFVLPVRDGWTGYLDTLSGQYPSKARREMRRLDAAGVTLSVEPLTRQLVPELAPLAANLNQRYGSDVDPDVVSVGLRMDCRSFKEDVYVSLARLDGRVIGFLELIWHRGNLWAWEVGFDYEARGNLPLWFAVFFYGLVDFASEKASILDHAIGTERAKSSRGCTPRPTMRLVKAL